MRQLTARPCAGPTRALSVFFKLFSTRRNGSRELKIQHKKLECLLFFRIRQASRSIEGQCIILVINSNHVSLAIHFYIASHAQSPQDVAGCLHDQLPQTLKQTGIQFKTFALSSNLH